MSKITKACETCAGAGWYQAHWGRCDCIDCSATGRVPDVEATLRAEVASLTKQHADELTAIRLARDARFAEYGAVLRARDEAVLKASQEVARLTEERNYARNLATDRLLANNGLAAEVARLTATLAERDGEVARLEGREREAAVIMANDRDSRYSYEYRDESRAAWLAGCKS